MASKWAAILKSTLTHRVLLHSLDKKAFGVEAYILAHIRLVLICGRQLQRQFRFGHS
jgi:hypothetical protein